MVHGRNGQRGDSVAWHVTLVCSGGIVVAMARSMEGMTVLGLQMNLVYAPPDHAQVHQGPDTVKLTHQLVICIQVYEGSIGQTFFTPQNSWTKFKFKNLLLPFLPLCFVCLPEWIGSQCFVFGYSLSSLVAIVSDFVVSIQDRSVWSVHWQLFIRWKYLSDTLYKLYF